MPIIKQAGPTHLVQVWEVLLLHREPRVQRHDLGGRDGRRCGQLRLGRALGPVEDAAQLGGEVGLLVMGVSFLLCVASDDDAMSIQRPTDTSRHSSPLYLVPRVELDELGKGLALSLGHARQRGVERRRGPHRRVQRRVDGVLRRLLR